MCNDSKRLKWDASEEYVVGVVGSDLEFTLDAFFNSFPMFSKLPYSKGLQYKLIHSSAKLLHKIVEDPHVVSTFEEEVFAFHSRSRQFLWPTVANFPVHHKPLTLILNSLSHLASLQKYYPEEAFDCVAIPFSKRQFQRKGRYQHINGPATRTMALALALHLDHEANEPLVNLMTGTQPEVMGKMPRLSLTATGQKFLERNLLVVHRRPPEKWRPSPPT